MNRIYRLIWSRTKKAIIVVSENAKAQGKSNGKTSTATVGALVVGGLLGFGANAASASPPAANVLPTGYQVTAGAAAVSSLGNTLNVQQSSQRAAINWQTFSIGSDATVNFLQPNTSSVILNRVVGTEQSVIAGALNANGQVFLLNSNGVLFTQGASVNTGGLVASILNLSDADFMAGRSTFTANGSQSSIINMGTIKVTDGGYVALLGNQVLNEGVITARLGTAVLAAGDNISLNFNGNSLVGVVINQGTLNALVANKQAIYADGGQVILTAKGADTVLASAVNNTGEIRAQTVANQAGRIYLLGEGGTVNVEGTLDASAPTGGSGGFIETSGTHVEIANSAKVSTAAASGLTGSWLLDPVDFTIAASNGDITGNALNTLLLSNSIRIQTSTGTNTATNLYANGSTGTGNINVNDTTNPVTWSSHTLTLSAYSNININAPMNGSGTASLALLYGQGSSTGVINGVTATYNINAPVNLPAGNNFSTQLGSNGANLVNYTVITSTGASGEQSTSGHNTLQGMAYSGSLNGHYALGANISTATPTGTWNSPTGFVPIGNSTTPFTGTFEGLGHTISNITTSTYFLAGSYIGLFGAIGANGLVQNFTLSIAAGGLDHIGGLAGSNAGTINNVTVTSSLSTDTNQGSVYNIGGLVGYNSGTINNSQASNTAGYSGNNVGGLVGYNTGTINASSASGVVGGAAGGYLGGLVGYNTGTINSGSASVNVSGATGGNAGGLVGYNTGTIVSGSASGSVSGGDNIGGLVGASTTAITNASATGNVSGGNNVGGLVGSTTASVSGSSASGIVTGGDYVGGLVGLTTSSVASSHATTGSVSGVDYVGGLVGSGATAITSSSASDNVTASGGTGYVGGLIGNSAGTIDSSSATGNVASSGGYVGGLAGSGTTSISNSSATGNVTGGDYVGGLVGNNSGSISSSHATGSVGGAGSYVGGLAGSNIGGTISSSFTTGTGTVSGVVDVGGLVGNNTGSILSGTATGTVSGHNSTGGLVGNNSGSISAGSSSGSVSASGAYGFDTGGLVGTNSGTINSSSFATGNVTSTNSNVGGLVGNNTGTITPAYATGSVSGSNYVGGLIGYNHSAITIDSSHHTGNVTGTGFNVGGLMGKSTSAVTNSYATGNVTSSGSFVGGLIGYTTNTITSGTASGSVGGNNDVGGLVGYNSSSITSSSASGNVSGTGNNIGGLVGYNIGGTISTSFTSGSGLVSGVNNIGGLVGYNTGTINPSNATGNVSGSSYVGGLVGYNNSAILIDNCHATGNATGTGNYIGGLIGKSVSDVNNSSATGNVTNSGNYVGGLIGLTYASVNSSSATGNVTNSGKYVGGLVGYTYGTNTSGTASGSVGGASAIYVGGLVGYNTSNITASTASGSVSGSSYAGGLVGKNTGTISNAYSTGNVTATSEVGGLVGYNTGILSNAFYNINQVSINGSNQVTAGGIYNAQYNDWFNHSETLTISNYSATLPAGNGGYYNVSSQQGLNDMLGFSESNAANNFRLTASFSLTAGYYIPYFAGSFDGGNNTLSNLTLTLPNSMTGMFGFLPNSSTTITNLGVVNASLTSGMNYVGGLVGYNYGGGAITNSYVSSVNISTGSMTGYTYGNVGGLIGYNHGGSISNCYVTGNVSTGSVATGSYVGGLVGNNPSGNISNSYASVNVTTGNNGSGWYNLVGGLVGYNGGTISNSFATGNVNAAGNIVYGNSYVGGLVGAAGGSISNSYAMGNVSNTGSVSGSSYVGGLIGNNWGVTVSNSYAKGTVSATGTVSGTKYLGGLSGNGGTFSNSFYDNQTTGQTQGISGTQDVVGSAWGMATVAMQTQANFTSATTPNGATNPGNTPAWDFITPVWKIFPNANNGYPCLAWSASCVNSTPIYLDLISGSSVYGSTPVFTYAYDTSPTYGSGTVIANATVAPVGTVGWTGAPTLTSSVNTYSVTPNISGITSVNSAYTLSAGNAANWSITARPVTLSGAKTYNGLNSIAGSLLSLTNTVNGDSVTVGGSGTLASANAGSQSISSLSGLTLSNANYTVVGGSGTVSVGQAPLTVTASNASKTYGQTPTLTAFTSSGLVNSQTIGSVTETSAGTAATAGVSNSPYAITPSAATGGTFSASNYSITYVNGSLTVNPLPVSIATVNGATRVYDGTTNAATNLLTVSNAINGDTVTLSGNGVLAGSNAGAEAFSSLTGLSLNNANYTLTGGSTSGSVLVSQAPLTITASNASKTYGQTPTLTAFTSSGLVNSQTIGSVTETSAGTAVTAGVSNSPYAITPSAATGGTFSASNYSITYVNGSLTVNPLPVSIATVNGATRVYDGTTNAATNLLTVSNAINGDTVTLSGNGTLTGRSAGTEALGSLAGLSLNNPNYTLTGGALSGSVLVTQLPVNVATVSGATEVYNGSTNAPANLLTITNILTGDSVALSGNATLAGPGPGNEAVSLAGLSLNNPNYTLTGGTASGTVDVTAASNPTAISNVITNATVVQTASNAPTQTATPVAVITQTPQNTSGGQVSSFVNVVTPLPQLSAVFGGSTQLAIISAPSANEPTQVVSLSQARGMLQPVNNATVSNPGDVSAGAQGGSDMVADVRVPVSRNSLAEIVNGGVKLPTGVEQELFVVKAQ